MNGVVLPQVQKLAFSLDELHEIPIEEPFGVSLDDSANLWHTRHMSSVLPAKLQRVQFAISSRWLMKILKRIGSGVHS